MKQQLELWKDNVYIGIDKQKNGVFRATIQYQLGDTIIHREIRFKEVYDNFLGIYGFTEVVE